MAVNELHDRDPQLPLASLCLLVPPLRLMSACMWRVAQQRNVQQYGKLAEFITLVTEMVPELLTPRQRAEVVLGLRARLILELLQRDGASDSKEVQEQLSAVRLLDTPETPDEFPDGELGVSKTAFLELVQTFTDQTSSTKKDDFFKNVFPEHYGGRFDTSLQILVWEFLSRLEDTLPVSGFAEVASNPDLDTLDPRLDQFGSDTEDLRTLLQHPPKGSAKIQTNRFPFRSAVILSSLASKETSLTPADPFSEEEEEEEEEEEGEGPPPAARLQDSSGPSGTPADPHDRPSPQEEPSAETAEYVPSTDDDDDDDVVGGDIDDAQSGAPVSPASSLDDGRTHTCPHCDLSFPRWADLLDHRCPVAPTPQPAPPPRRRVARGYQCDRCPRQLVSEFGLQRHQLAHHQPIICPQCGKTLKHRSSLAVHLRRHAAARPFACSVCGKTFKEKGVLKTHMRVHSPDRPYLCSECGRAFRHLASYEMHARRHTGEKPFGCDVCEGRFFTAQRLKEHGRTHTGERPYACARCDKRFSSNNLLKRHVRVHTGEKPYRCPHCDKGFTQHSNMKIHLRVHRHDEASKKR